ncbi:MAG: YhbY family RNA-binding protein [Verrucomicrobia bacterium]|nr:YhbY family RNA-binding protein [Verrucomicrobiota bacterium]
MKSDLPNPLIRQLKAQAQRMDATLKVGKHGLSAEFLKSVDEVLKHRALIKVKFTEFKEQKKELAPVLADKTASNLVQLIGNVAVLYRAKPANKE